VTVPPDGPRRDRTPPKPEPAAPHKPRRAATERALRRRDRREKHLPGREAPKTSTAKAGTSKKNTPKTEATSRRATPTRDTTARATTARGRRDPVERTPGVRVAGRTSTVRTRTAPPPADRGAGPEAGTRERMHPRRPSTRPSARQVVVRRMVALVVGLGLIGLVIAVLWTPLLGVRSVEVVGVRDLTVAQVEAIAQVPTGTPMLRLDTVGITTRVAQLPRVASVDVSREWPSTVRIDITERDPVGIVTKPDGVHLVDSTGLDYATVATAPPGLPAIQLPTIAPTDARTLAVVRVLVALPSQLRAQVVAASAASPGSVTLALADGKRIRWGSADDSARKAAVLAALMTRPGNIYDVSSPELPTIS
jgi:cell division protein FtsQ